ncbi:unnamed protein product, partial [Iphiclides podalirius]
MSLQECRLKRSRVPNFTADEKSLLTRLVNKRRDIVECKLTDGNSIARKKEAWLSIEREFNSEANDYKRDHIILKRAWDNLKASTRKVRAADKSSQNKTGGGPPVQLTTPQKKSNMNTVEETVPSLSCEVKNNFDSDGVVLGNISISIDESGSDTFPFKTDSAAEFLEVCEQNNTSQTESMDTNVSDEHITNPLPLNRRSRSTNDFVCRESALRLKTFQIKSKLENQILKAKLKTALLQQEAAQVSLETAKLELEIKKKLWKAQF